MAGMLSIGEFSRVVGMTVKALRFYHEEGLLVPAVVDPRSGYRYYDAAQVETARAIRFLRENAGQPRPFFLYVPTFAPHGGSNLQNSGIHPPKKYLGRAAAGCSTSHPISARRPTCQRGIRRWSR